jgi:hypothetical protein
MLWFASGPAFMTGKIRFLYYFSIEYLYSQREDRSAVRWPEPFRGCAMYRIFNTPQFRAAIYLCFFAAVLSGSDVRAEYALADTIRIGSIEVQPGSHASFPIYLQNAEPVTGYCVPVHFDNSLLQFDSVSFEGTRTPEQFSIAVNCRPATGNLILAAIGSETAVLSPGTGAIAELWVTINPDVAETLAVIDYDFFPPAGKLHLVDTTVHSVKPYFQSGSVYISEDLRGDANDDNRINVADAVFLVSFVFKGEDAPLTLKSGDANSDGKINVGDAVYIVNFIFRNGPPPAAYKSAVGHPVVVSCNLIESVDGRWIEICLDAEQDIGGVQIEFSKPSGKNVTGAVETAGRGENIPVYFLEDQSSIKIGMIDLVSGRLIPPGKGAIARIPIHEPGQLTVSTVIVCDRFGYELPVELQTDIADASIPENSLEINRPNPFNPSTTIDFTFSRPGRVTISIFNILGQKIRTLTDRPYEVGSFQVTWDGHTDGGSIAASGIYFYKMKSPGYVQTRKMLLVR